MGYKLNGVESEGLPVGIAEIFTKNYDVKVFVETGTAGGESIKVASRLFERCYTIELIEGRVLDKSLGNVTYHTGDSVEILPQIIAQELSIPVFFFLDAHFSDSVPNTTGKKECPVLDELQVISSHKNPIILIDDARLFYGHPPYPNDPREWPSIEEIFYRCRVLFPNNHTTIIDDFVLCYPHKMSDWVSEEWRRRFTARYPSADDKLKTDAKNVFNALKKYLDA